MYGLPWKIIFSQEWGDSMMASEESQMKIIDESQASQMTENHYRKTSNISRTLVGDKIVDNSDVVGASPVGAAPTTSSFST